MMTILTRSSDRQTVSLGNKIASSGEGEVWETNFSGTLAKIYHDPTPEKIAKLKVMLANPPVDPMKSKNHISIAFPQDLLLDAGGNCGGFLMPAVRSSRELPSIYHPRLRKRNAPGFNWYYLHVTALNTAWIIQAIHEKGYVLGDIKPQNILVNDRALVAVIDTDSFQVRDSKTGKVYRYTVGSDGFTPVELLGKDFSTTDQTEICDRFRLAVLIHYLLFGYHPFSGEWTGAGESPDQTELIRKGLWYGGNNSLICPSRTTIPLDVVHPEIKRLFLKCFNDGHALPKLRPTAEDWHNALQVAVNNLTACSKIDSHHYSRSYGKCYWCERSVTLGVDIFPGGLITATTAVKATMPSTVIQTIPFSTPSCKATTAVSQLSSSTALPTTRVPSLQALSKRFLNSQKRWQIFIGLGLGSLAFSAAALNLPSSKQISHSSTPISVSPSPVFSSNPSVTNTENRLPSASHRERLQRMAEDRLKAEQAEADALKKKQERHATLMAEQNRQAALQKHQEQAAETEQKKQAALKAKEIATRAEQARLEAAIKAERDRQASIQAERARQAAIKRNQARQAGIQAERARQTAIKRNRDRQAAITTLDKSYTPTRQQKSSTSQTSTPVNTVRPWASKAPNKSASNDLENVIRGGNP